MDNKRGTRYQDTHKKIMETALEMLNNRDIGELKVSQICQTLSINRSTFYDHFEDIYNLFSELEWGMQAELTTQFENNNIHSMEEAFQALFTFIRQNQTFYRYYLNHNGVVTLSDVFVHKIMRLDEVFRFEGRMREVQYRFDFLLFGFNGMLKRWVLERDCRKSDEKYMMEYMMSILRE